MKITKQRLQEIIKEELAALSEKAKETVSDEISAQVDKGKGRGQAVAIALSKRDDGEIKSEDNSDDEDNEKAVVLKDPPDIKRMKQGLKRISRPRSAGDFRSNKERFKKP